jgi:two-component system cell cycle sensor histidine kinase/response regulator CckA
MAENDKTNFETENRRLKERVAELERQLEEEKQALRQQAAALQESEAVENTARLQTVLDTMPAMITLRDTDGRVVFTNKSNAEAFGIPPEDFRGKTYDELFGAVNDVTSDDLIKQVLETGEPVRNYQHSPPRFPGKATIVNSSPVMNGRDEITGVVTVSLDITDRKQAEDLLRRRSESNRLLNTVTTMAGDASTFEDAMRICLDEVCAFTGWPIGHVYQRSEDHHDTLVPTEIWHIAAPDHFAEFRRITENTSFSRGVGLPGRVLYSGEPAWIVDIAKDKNFPRVESGTTQDLKSAFAFPILVQNEVLAVLEYFSTDEVKPAAHILDLIAQLGRQLGLVVERKHAEEELRQNERRFRDFAEAASDWFWETGPDLRFSFISERFYQISGLTREESIGVSRDEIGDSDNLNVDEDKWSEHRADLQARRPFKNFEYPLKTADKDTIIIRTSGVPIHEPDGAFLGYRGTATDITKRIQAEDALLESAAQLSLVTNALPIVISHVGKDHRFIMINDAATDWYGSQASEYIGETVEKALGQAGYEKVKDKINEALSGKEVSFEATMEFATGAVRDVRALYIPHFGPGNEVVGFFALIQDITVQNRAEEALRQSQKMEAVGQLTGGIAHDFNNLLGVVVGNLDLAEEMAGNQRELLTYISNAIRGAERGAELTRQLLAFGRRQPLAPKAIDLNGQVSGMLDMLRRTLGETIEIEAVRGAGLWICDADPGQVENALLNLAINARDAMPSGGKLTIETANARLDDEYAITDADLKSGQYVMLAVTDTGAGMAPNIREQAFEPFFTTKETGLGSGLGLSMVFGFAKQSNGHAAIYSEEGQGTTVKLYLPRAHREADNLFPRATETPRSRGESVLVVEDDPDLRVLTERQLKALGYKTQSAMDGKTAIEILDSDRHFDLLLTDVVLPGGMGGVALSREAKTLRPTIKTLYMSGYTENAIVHHGKLEDGVVLLEKPFRKLDLARKTREVLDS